VGYNMEFVNFSIPRFKQLPKVPLYKDQVIIYLEDLAKSLNIESNEKLLTPTMLNSYVKQRVIQLLRIKNILKSI
jgi:hypothetical protein